MKSYSVAAFLWARCLSFPWVVLLNLSEFRRFVLKQDRAKVFNAHLHFSIARFFFFFFF